MSDRRALIDGLREFATFLEMHPDAPMPHPGCFNAFLINKEQFQSAARVIGGRLDKQHQYQDYAVLRRKFGPIEYDINVDRSEVCERVVISTKTVPEQIIPAHEEDVVEWRCHPILEDK